MSKRMVFEPTSDELYYISENIESWTDWCRTKLQKEQKNNRQVYVENLGTRLLAIIAGCLIASLSFLVFDIAVIVTCFILGSGIIVVSSFSLWRIYVNESRQ